MFFHKGSFYVSVSSITRGCLAAGSVAGGIHLMMRNRSFNGCAQKYMLLQRQMSTVNLALLAVGSCGEWGCAIAVASEKAEVRLVN